jgi:hypothetical protein
MEPNQKAAEILFGGTRFSKPEDIGKLLKVTSSDALEHIAAGAESFEPQFIQWVASTYDFRVLEAYVRMYKKEFQEARFLLLNQVLEEIDRLDGSINPEEYPIERVA